MNVGVVGTGYVGLVVGAGLADAGHHVVACDVDPDKIAVLRAGRVPIVEPGLGELCARGVAAGHLGFSTDVADLASADVIVLAVGTPPGPDGAADLTDLWA